MPFPKASFRRATPADMPTLLKLMPLYYADDHLEFNLKSATAAITAFLDNEAYGQIWLISKIGEKKTVGYTAVTYGFSFEYGGREAFVDELFVQKEFRGQGMGGEAIRHILAECKRDGICAVRLEVTSHNESAGRLYKKLGFKDLGRTLLAYPLSK